MTPFLVLAVQCTFSIIIFYLLCKWFLIPNINTENKNDVLSLLLIINIFRYLPLSLYMPGQVSADFPDHVKEIVAFGDFVSGILALISALLLKSKNKGAILFVWVFSMVSIMDMFLALYFAMSAKVYELNLGVNYFTVSVYVPMLIVVQTMILKILITKNKVWKNSFM